MRWLGQGIRTGNDLFLTTKRIVKKCRTGARFLQLFLFFWLALLLLLLTFCRHLLTSVWNIIYEAGTPTPSPLPTTNQPPQHLLGNTSSHRATGTCHAISKGIVSATWFETLLHVTGGSLSDYTLQCSFFIPIPFSVHGTYVPKICRH